MAVECSVTCSNNRYYLLDFIANYFYGSKLPSNRDVLGVFVKHHIEEKKKIRDSATKTIGDLISILIEQARIPVQPEHHAIKQLEKHFQSWKDLKCFRNRQTLAQKKKEKTFGDSLDDLFDISHANALNMIVNSEYKKFLLGQRKKRRRGCMEPADKSLAGEENQIALKREAEDMRKKRIKKECEPSTSKAVVLLYFTNSNSKNKNITKVSIFDEAEEPCSKRSRANTNTVTPSLAAALDRTCVSNRRATVILTKAGINLGHDPHK